jgi:hypothetical protein
VSVKPWDKQRLFYARRKNVNDGVALGVADVAAAALTVVVAEAAADLVAAVEALEEEAAADLRPVMAVVEALAGAEVLRHRALAAGVALEVVVVAAHPAMAPLGSTVRRDRYPCRFWSIYCRFCDM